MCGITGLVKWGDTETLARMTDAQAHRGPDDRGLWEWRGSDGTYVGLGSRRLAILDRSPAGHMPMSTPDGQIWITYNGEVYNYRELRRELEAKGHRLQSNTDTEVILHLYADEGPACVLRLNGMFAFAICDLRSPRLGLPTLCLARDHFGIKPLYYVNRGDRLAFASEIKALLKVSDIQAGVDLESLHQYLTFLWVPDPMTMFKGVQKLPPGHYALFRDGQLDVVQYWDLTFPTSGFDYRRTEAELVEEVRERLRRSVQSQMVSDVPIGAFLSAGLDSSSVVAMMAQATSQSVRTYTITFPSKARSGQYTLDDPAIAARQARRLGCEHHEIVVEPEVASLLPRLIWHMDEPVADPALIMAYLVAREARQTVTVLLSGVGGDEIFAGYRKYYAHRLARLYRLLPSPLRQGLIEPTLSRLGPLRGTPYKGLLRLGEKLTRSAALSARDAFLANCTYLDDEQKAQLYSPDLLRRIGRFDSWGQHRAHQRQVAYADLLNQFLYLDTKAFMVSLNLNYNDKMSMASSVEVRVPFLDRELAEFVAWQVPPSLKIRGKLIPTTKYILREAMSGIVNDEVLRQPKAGFGAPIDQWLAGDLREMVDDLLSETQVRQRGYFEPSVTQRMIQEHRDGRRNWSFQIWQLLTFELWLQTFVDQRQPKLLGGIR